MTILKTSLFLTDYREVVIHIGESNPEAAERFCDAVENALKLISEHPQICRLAGFRSAPKVRRKVLHPFPNYSVYYEDRADEILLIRLLHGARDTEALLPNG